MKQMTLKVARQVAELTQEVAAKKIGVARSTLKKWEKGESFPTQPYIEKMCEVYGVKYDELLFK